MSFNLLPSSLSHELSFSDPSVSLVFGSHLSSTQSATLPTLYPIPFLPVSFISFHVLPALHSQIIHCHSLTRTLRFCPLCWPWRCIFLNEPLTCFVFSYLWFTCCCWRKPLSHADAHVLQLVFPILPFPQYCQGISHKSRVGLIFLSSCIATALT